MKTILIMLATVALAATLAQGCGDDTGPTPDVSDIVDNVEGAADADADADADGDGTPACIDPAPPGASGMNPGGDCLGCHGPGGTSPTLTIGGTIYDSLAGTNPVGGATVVVTDSLGAEIRIVTGGNGNFFSSAVATPPFTVRVSKCPDDVSMPIAAAGGSCNSCHAAGNRVHLP